MSEVEINNVIMKVQSIIQEDGFEDGFQFALDQVRAFPTCENLCLNLFQNYNGCFGLGF